MTIRPPHAAAIWADANSIFLELPDATGQTSRTHTLTFPKDAYGIQRILQLLKVRNSQSRLGTAGEPFQSKVDDDIRKMKLKIDPEKIRRPAPKLALTPELSASLRGILRRMGI